MDQDKLGTITSSPFYKLYLSDNKTADRAIRLAEDPELTIIQYLESK